MSDSAQNEENFIDLVLAGRARVTEIDDYIESWHNAPAGSLAARLELHEFLGMTWEEYRLWGERPESLRFTVAARRAGRSVTEVLEQTKLAGAAARTAEHLEAAKVLQWLIDRGRIEAV